MRRLERWARDRVQRGAARLLGGPRAVASIPPGPHRVLVIRYQVIGDLVLTTGLIRQIAASRPGTQVDVLVRASVAPVLDGMPYVRQVIAFDCTGTRRWPSLALLAHIRKQRYDVVVDCMSIRDATPTALVLFLLAAGAKFRIGFRSTRNHYLYNVPVDRDQSRHHAEQCAELAAPFGGDGADCRPQLAISPEERLAADGRWSALGAGLRLFVNISAADPRNEWRDERLVDVIRQVQAARGDLRVLVTGLPDQVPRLERIAEAAGVSWCTGSLREVIARVATADAVLTPDTGVIHVAAAFGRPTVSWHTPNKWMWTPYRVPSRAVFADDDTSVDSIAVSAVASALAGLLDEQYGTVRA